MSKLTPIDLSFLLMENSSNQMHMACYQLLRIPARQKTTFVAKLLKAYRTSEVASPFNQQLKWLGQGVASWEQVEPDLKYHIRHLAVAAPGTMEQFYELLSFLNAPLLDRNRPLWECYIIEGLEDNQCAVLIRMHHALLDGASGLKLFQNSMNTSAGDKRIRTMWTPMGEAPKRHSRAGKSQLDKLVAQLGNLPEGARGLTSELASLGAQALKIKPRSTRLPFGADRTRLNHSAQSSERRYGNCVLPFDRVKAVSKVTNTTVNDVLMTVIDDSLHRYLGEYNAEVKKPLVAMMPMSTRKPGDASVGNQVSAELVEMGAPDTDLSSRLQQIHKSTARVKNRSQKLPSAVRQFYSLVTLGSGSLIDIASVLQSLPSFNLVVSNMIGPREQLYVGGAPLTTFSGLPIVPPGGGLNVTFATIHNTVNLAVAAAPESIEDPFKLTQFMLDSFEKLEEVTSPKQTTQQSNRTKIPARKKTRARK
jgi:diacylglycerol O-acyltransferase